MMSALWRKEWMEAVRAYRILFIPLLFVLLSISQPLAYHVLPTILSEADLPGEGGILFPTLSGPEILVAAFGQLNQIGLLIVVLAAMGAISREVEGGQAGLLFSLGIPRPRYLGVKAVVFAMIVIASVLVAMAATAYYTSLLVEAVPMGRVLGASLVYSLYLLFALMLTLALSARTASGLAAGGMAIGFTILFSILSLVPALERWVPGQAAVVAGDLISGGPVEYGWLGVEVGWIALALAAALSFLRRREV